MSWGRHDWYDDEKDCATGNYASCIGVKVVIVFRMDGVRV